MATYSFPQFKATITDPTITVGQVNDSIQEKTCSVYVFLETEKARFGVQFFGFQYAKTWEYSDIESFVQEEMKKHLI